MYGPYGQVRTRVNGVLPGMGLLIGALIIGFGATRPWATFDTSVVRLFGVSLPVHHDFGFGQVFLADGTAVPFNGLLIALAIVMGLVGLALIATRIPGLGIAWRFFGAFAVAIDAVLSFLAWQSVNSPEKVVAAYFGGDNSDAGAVARYTTKTLLDSGAISIGAGTGLWLITIGGALSLLAIVLPASKKTTPIYRGPLMPGYPPPYWPPSQAQGWIDQQQPPGYGQRPPW